MSSIAKTHKLSIFAMFIAAALIGSVVAVGDSYAYAGGKKKSNDAEQEIELSQASEQNAQCVSSDFTIASCNNVNIQLQAQLGDLALGQQ